MPRLTQARACPSIGSPEMATNASSKAPDYSHLAFGALGYMCIGSVAGVGNLLSALSIARLSALRDKNQYVLVMTLAFADAFNMIGFFLAGFYRLWLLTTGQLGVFISPLECLLRPHVLPWLFSGVFSALMLTVISCDRLFLVAFPSKYLNLPSPKYGYLLCGCSFGSTTFMAFLGLAALFMKEGGKTENPICFSPDFIDSPSLLSHIYVNYQKNVHSWLSFASVAILIAIVPIYKRYNNTQVSSNKEASMASERRMTTSLCLSGLCTFCLYCVPYYLAHQCWRMGFNYLAWTFFITTMTNPLANIFIYQIRHWEMRAAIRALILCKHMPPMLHLWKTVDHKSIMVSQHQQMQELPVNFNRTIVTRARHGKKEGPSHMPGVPVAREGFTEF